MTARQSRPVRLRRLCRGLHRIAPARSRAQPRGFVAPEPTGSTVLVLAAPRHWLLLGTSRPELQFRDPIRDPRKGWLVDGHRIVELEYSTRSGAYQWRFDLDVPRQAQKGFVELAASSVEERTAVRPGRDHGRRRPGLASNGAAARAVPRASAPAAPLRCASSIATAGVVPSGFAGRVGQGRVADPHNRCSPRTARAETDPWRGALCGKQGLLIRPGKASRPRRARRV